VDAGTLPPGKHELVVTVTPDTPGVTITEVVPATITVNISPSGPVLRRSPSPPAGTVQEETP
jgi:hypothetical protein